MMSLTQVKSRKQSFYYNPRCFSWKASQAATASGCGGRKPRRDPPRRDDNLPQLSVTVDERHYRPAIAMVIGHSFVRRLQQFHSSTFGHYFNLGFSYSQLQVVYYGHSGLTVQDVMYYHLASIDQIKPDIIYLELGTNDLCSPTATPMSVGNDLRLLVTQLLNLGVKFVVTGQVIFRRGRGIPRAVPGFNRRVVTLNHYCARLLGTHSLPNSYFWHHRGMWHPACQVLARDGVHLNRQGMVKQGRSIRGALLYALRRIRSQLLVANIPVIRYF